QGGSRVCRGNSAEAGLCRGSLQSGHRVEPRGKGGCGADGTGAGVSTFARIEERAAALGMRFTRLGVLIFALAPLAALAYEVCEVTPPGAVFDSACGKGSGSEHGPALGGVVACGFGVDHQGLFAEAGLSEAKDGSAGVLDGRRPLSAFRFALYGAESLASRGQ